MLLQEIVHFIIQHLEGFPRLLRRNNVFDTYQLGFVGKEFDHHAIMILFEELDLNKRCLDPVDLISKLFESFLECMPLNFQLFD